MKNSAKLYKHPGHTATDVINAPSHYVEGRKIEPIEVIEDWDLSHHFACALKYIARAGRKENEIHDIKKAIWYLERRMMLVENRNT